MPQLKPVATPQTQVHSGLDHAHLLNQALMKSAASDITLVLLSHVLITQITHLGHVKMAPQHVCFKR